MLLITFIKMLPRRLIRRFRYAMPCGHVFLPLDAVAATPRLLMPFLHQLPFRLCRYAILLAACFR